MNVLEGAAALVRRMVVSSLSAGAETRRISVPGCAAEIGDYCYVIDGTADDKAHRVLVEWESLEGGASADRIARLSKWKRALGAETAFLCCERGVRAEIMLSAIKEGIHVVEAFPRGPSRIHTGSAALVRHVRIEDWNISLNGGGQQGIGYSFDSRSEPGGLLFCDKPIHNWLSRSSHKLLRRVSEDCILKVKYSLKRAFPLSVEGRILETTALEAWYECRCRIQLHSACLNLASACYEPRRKRIVDRRAATDYGNGNTGGEEVRDEALLFGSAPNGAKPDLHVFHPVRALEGMGTPEFEDCIESVNVSIESGTHKLRPVPI
jgi:hypothetical protein